MASPSATEVKINLADQSYIVPLTNSINDFYVKNAGSGQNIQVSSDVAAKLFGAETAWQQVQTYFANEYAGTTAANWHTLIATISKIQALEGANKILGTTAGLLVSEFVVPGSSVKAVNDTFFGAAVGLAPAVGALLFAAIGMGDATTMLQRADSTFDSLTAKFANGDALDFQDIKRCLDDGVNAVNIGGMMARTAEKTVDLQASFATDVATFAKGFTDGLIDGLGLKTTEIKSYQFVDTLWDLADVTGYFASIKQATQAQIWHYPNLTYTGLNHISNDMAGKNYIDPLASVNTAQPDSIGGTASVIFGSDAQPLNFNSPTQIQLILSDAPLSNNFSVKAFVKSDLQGSYYSVSVSGAEHIYNNVSSVEIFGSAFDDFMSGTSGNDYIHGGSGNDELSGLIGNDVIYGGSGNDNIYTGSGICQVNGGSGQDYISIDQRAATIALSFDAVAAAGGLGADLGDGSNFKNVERFWVGTGSGDDSLSAGAGLKGSNVWFAGDGNDRLTVDLSSEADIVTLGSTRGTGVIGIGQNNYGRYVTSIAFDSVESFNVSGGLGDDVLSGASGDDTLNGNGGKDNLYGEGGNDTLSGGAQDDTINTGTGIDHVDGGAGRDQANIDRSTATSDLSFNAVAAASAGGTGLGDGSTFKSIEIFGLVTGSGNDTLIAGAGLTGQNFWFAGDGNDRLTVDLSWATDVVTALPGTRDEIGIGQQRGHAFPVPQNDGQRGQGRAEFVRGARCEQTHAHDMILLRRMLAQIGQPCIARAQILRDPDDEQDKQHRHQHEAHAGPGGFDHAPIGHQLERIIERPIGDSHRGEAEAGDEDDEGGGPGVEQDRG